VKIPFYVLFGTAAALGGYFFVSSVLGGLSLGGASALAAKGVLLVAAVAGSGVLYWAYRLGEVQGRWLAGFGAVLLAVLAFQAVMVAGRLALG
jgi:hypothetical protein